MTNNTNNFTADALSKQIIVSVSYNDANAVLVEGTDRERTGIQYTSDLTYLTDRITSQGHSSVMIEFPVSQDTQQPLTPTQKRNIPNHNENIRSNAYGTIGVNIQHQRNARSFNMRWIRTVQDVDLLPLPNNGIPIYHLKAISGLGYINITPLAHHLLRAYGAIDGLRRKTDHINDEIINDPAYLEVLDRFNIVRNNDCIYIPTNPSVRQDDETKWVKLTISATKPKEASIRVSDKGLLYLLPASTTIIEGANKTLVKDFPNVPDFMLQVIKSYGTACIEAQEEPTFLGLKKHLVTITTEVFKTVLGEDGERLANIDPENMPQNRIDELQTTWIIGKLTLLLIYLRDQHEYLRLVVTLTDGQLNRRRVKYHNAIGGQLNITHRDEVLGHLGITYHNDATRWNEYGDYAKYFYWLDAAAQGSLWVKQETDDDFKSKHCKRFKSYYDFVNSNVFGKAWDSEEQVDVPINRDGFKALQTALAGCVCPSLDQIHHPSDKSFFISLNMVNPPIIFQTSDAARITQITKSQSTARPRELLAQYVRTSILTTPKKVTNSFIATGAFGRVALLGRMVLNNKYVSNIFGSAMAIVHNPPNVEMMHILARVYAIPRKMQYHLVANTSTNKYTNEQRTDQQLIRMFAGRGTAAGTDNTMTTLSEFINAIRDNTEFSKTDNAIIDSKPVEDRTDSSTNIVDCNHSEHVGEVVATYYRDSDQYDTVTLYYENTNPERFLNNDRTKYWRVVLRHDGNIRPFSNFEDVSYYNNGLLKLDGTMPYIHPEHVVRVMTVGDLKRKQMIEEVNKRNPTDKDNLLDILNNDYLRGLKALNNEPNRLSYIQSVAIIDKFLDEANLYARFASQE